MADTPTGETVTPEALGTNVTPTATPVVNAVDSGEVERLRKQAEQAEMRANQLANQLKAKEDAEEAAKTKKLEEDNQYKELFEQEKTKREALESEQTEKEKTAELEKAKAETLSQFSDDVKKLAEEVGITLLDTDEQSVEAFKGKLEKISATASAQATVTPNNPNPQNNSPELSTEQLRDMLHDDKDGNAFHDLVTKKYPGIASMTKQQ